MIDVFQPLWLQSLYLLINSNSKKIQIKTGMIYHFNFSLVLANKCSFPN